ncbi:DUF2520 domain-containing protein [Conexibacter sp. DBS9H8]|uniref:DUF2520 domain-containing protein n=1 Tax=Conexibacter sp. DBS9H8 TaxID=2937801 RepID=UPI00200CB30A|nr:DUF2520 domain-containing protein [Conexibacter sp. DBS9H8]
MRVAVLGAGRLGTALAASLVAAGLDAIGPVGRGEIGRLMAERLTVVMLCVPDASIATVAAKFPPEQRLGHCSGALGLDVLGRRSGLSLHPLTSLTGAEASLAGVGAALDATDTEALTVAQSLARSLGMRPFRIASEDRAAYHAAASCAANFLVTVEAAAERIAATAGVSRDLLVPLVRAAVENWATLGPERALTGPIARGDVGTVARQREALTERTPELVALFDALVQATEDLARAARAVTA